MGVLKDLFIELFNVNHLMLNMIDDLENESYGNSFLTDFFVQCIRDEFTKEKLIEYSNETGYSVLNEIGTEEERTEFINSLFEITKDNETEVNVKDYATVWNCNCSEYGKQTVMSIDDINYLPYIRVIYK